MSQVLRDDDESNSGSGSSRRISEVRPAKMGMLNVDEMNDQHNGMENQSKKDEWGSSI